MLLYSTSRHIDFVSSRHCSLLSVRLWGTYACLISLHWCS